MPEGIKFFTGNAHKDLAQEIAGYLDIPVGDATVTEFSDGEIMVQINENVRGTDVFVLHPRACPSTEILWNFSSWSMH